LVAERASELALWDVYLSETRYVGEVGLDAGPRFYKSFDLQKQVFRHVLQRCAEAGDKIITVHSIRAAKAVLDLIEAYLPPTKGKVVLHWFTGSKAEAKRALELGCYFSVNAAMLDNERHSSMVAAIPLDRLLTETDGPFTKTDDRPSKPADVAVVVESLSRIHGVAASALAATVRNNLRSLLEANGKGN
jgi:TatD DNase family protein